MKLEKDMLFLCQLIVSITNSAPLTTQSSSKLSKLFKMEETDPVVAELTAAINIPDSDSLKNRGI